MNFLAHLVLAPQTPHGLIGSVAPDMIRGPLPGGLHAEVLEAAREHQRIDRYTDAHPAFARTRDRLRSVVEPRLAGVLADVLYDHVLASRWSVYCAGEHAGYVAGCERRLLLGLGRVPGSMQAVVRRMVDEHWLLSYATAQGVRARLVQMSARLTRRFDRPVDLAPPAEDLGRICTPIADDLDELWPMLKAFVADCRAADAPRLVREAVFSPDPRGLD